MQCPNRPYRLATQDTAISPYRILQQTRPGDPVHFRSLHTRIRYVYTRVRNAYASWPVDQLASSSSSSSLSRNRHGRGTSRAHSRAAGDCYCVEGAGAKNGYSDLIVIIRSLR